jgi:uncharacterized membrane protein required for colicin V production
MSLPFIDTILLIFLFGFIFYGFFFGLIRTFGLLVGVLVATILASRLYLSVSNWASDLFLGHDNLGRILVFILLFSLINRLVGILFSMIDGLFNILTIIPFLKTINRLLGALLGLFVGGLIIGLLLYISNKYAFIDHWFGKWLVDSVLAPYFLKLANILLPLLPEVLKKIDGLI